MVAYQQPLNSHSKQCYRAKLTRLHILTKADVHFKHVLVVFGPSLALNFSIEYDNFTKNNDETLKTNPFTVDSSKNLRQ